MPAPLVPIQARGSPSFIPREALAPPWIHVQSPRPQQAAAAARILAGGLALALALPGAGCRSAPPPEASSTLNTITTEPDPRLLTLGPNDVLAFSVYGQPELSSPEEGVLVSLEGDLMVPLVGPVPVEGLSQREAHEKITTALAAFYTDPVLTLNVVERRSKRFFLLGEFNQPGTYSMDTTLTVMEAMTQGRGLTSGAKRDRIALIRPQADGVEVHFFDQDTPDADSLVQVHPGDVIFASQSGAGRFTDQVVPFLQGIGFATSQIASLIIVADRP